MPWQGLARPAPLAEFAMETELPATPGVGELEGDLLARLNLPDRMWGLPPATFSGGEQQRVNIARGLVGDHPLLLLDEPTASLDAANRAVVIDLVNARKRRGTAIVAIVHGADVRDAIADRIVDVTAFAAAA